MRGYNGEIYSNKSNELIQNYAWKLQEKQLKIMEFLCSCYNTSYYDNEKNTITVGVADFIKELGFSVKGNASGWHYQMFEETIKTLSDYSIIGIGFNNKRRIIRLMNTVDFPTEKGDTTFVCYMSEDFKKCMEIQAKGNTKIEFRTIYKLKSKYAIKLYNLLRSWQGKSEVYFNVDWLREYLGVTAKSYLKYGKFKQAALDTAVKEINEKTNLIITFKGLSSANSRSRETTRVVFNIQKNEPKKTLPSSVAKSEAPDLTNDDFFDEDDITTEEHKYNDPYLGELALACDCEFDEDEMSLLAPIIAEKVPGVFSRSIEYNKQRRYRFLQRAYAALNIADKKGDVKTTRIKYIEGVLSKMPALKEEE